MLEKMLEKVAAFHRKKDAGQGTRVSTCSPQGNVENYPRALIFELMSRIVAAISGLIFIRSSIFLMEESTVA